MNSDIVLQYLLDNYKEPGEAIFLSDIHIENMTECNLRYHMKQLVDAGKIKRYKHGVYYFPKSIDGKEAIFNCDNYITARYLSHRGEQFGYYSNFTLANALGLTNQIPSILEIVTNNTSYPKKVIKVDSQSYIIRKSAVKITNENINILRLLDALKNIDQTAEIADAEIYKRLVHFIDDNNITEEAVMEYINHFPAKTHKALVDLGIYDYLISPELHQKNH